MVFDNLTAQPGFIPENTQSINFCPLGVALSQIPIWPTKFNCYEYISSFSDIQKGIFFYNHFIFAAREFIEAFGTVLRPLEQINLSWFQIWLQIQTSLNQLNLFSMQTSSPEFLQAFQKLQNMKIEVGPCLTTLIFLLPRINGDTRSSILILKYLLPLNLNSFNYGPSSMPPGGLPIFGAPRFSNPEQVIMSLKQIYEKCHIPINVNQEVLPQIFQAMTEQEQAAKFACYYRLLTLEK